MMAQPSYPALVFGHQFIVPYEFNIMVYRCPTGYLRITDINHNIMFTVILCDTITHRQRLMQDKHGTPIAMLRYKIRTAHDRWNAFRGESIATTDLIFSATRNHIIQNQTHVNVFLANETGCNDACDFRVKGSWSNRNCAFYKGESSRIIAQMLVGESPEKFLVTIYPNVDYAFIVALIAIVDAMKTTGTIKAVGHVATRIATGAITAAQLVTGVGFS